MVTYRQSADEESKSLKDPLITLEKMRTLYGKFDGTERPMADEVLTEWALSTNEAIRFDAIALIGDLKVTAAVPALRTLVARLSSEVTPGAPFELKKVQRLIADLTG